MKWELDESFPQRPRQTQSILIVYHLSSFALEGRSLGTNLLLCTDISTVLPHPRALSVFLLISAVNLRFTGCTVAHADWWRSYFTQQGTTIPQSTLYPDDDVKIRDEFAALVVALPYKGTSLSVAGHYRYKSCSYHWRAVQQDYYPFVHDSILFKNSVHSREYSRDEQQQLTSQTLRKNDVWRDFCWAVFLV